MQEPIRVLIVADSTEEGRKLEEIFVAPGFELAGSRIQLPVERAALADVIVIRSKYPQLFARERDTPILWVGAPIDRGRDHRGRSAVLLTKATPAQIRAAAAALAVGLRIENQSATSGPESSEFSFVEPMTERELDVLNLVAEGYSNPQIAAQLGVSRNTVKFHVSSIMDKLGASSRTEAVTIAVRQGLIII
ncbi:MAG: response regulator transcription factor [Acidobacteria bacterium]|nr:response regulator transcription factor [Acidobacteriota bacterium]